MRKFMGGLDVRDASIWIFLAIACGIAYLLYPHPQQVAKESGVTEIVYWHVGPVGDSMQAAIDEFERRNPQYRVVTGSATARDVTSDPTRFLLSVAGGMPPDLIFFDRFAIVEWASRGAFTDLTPFLEADKNNPDGVHKEDYVPSAWNEPIYKGKNYAVANSCDTRGFYYNADPLIRAGFMYVKNDPEVIAGDAQPGEARPPKTWEELCRKLIHAEGTISADGTVKLTSFVRRPAVNEGLPENAVIDLETAGVRPGDVTAIIAGTEVFRGRILDVGGDDTFRIDLGREQPPSMDRKIQIDASLTSNPLMNLRKTAIPDFPYGLA